jgi:F420-dependent oxidoreductase-like protein
VKLSLEYPETSSPARAIALAQQTEAAGFHGFFLGAAFGFDPLVVLGACGGATTSILLGSAVVPSWPRHPVVVAQQALTAQALSGGRFRLGIGVSHAPVMAMYGIEFDRPVSHLREYLQVVRALLHDGQVRFEGERYRVRAFLGVDGATAPPILLAALRPQMARVAGEFADAALPWLTPPAYVRDVLIPALADGAARGARAVPELIASVPVVLADGADAALAIAQRELAVYPHMPFYRAVFESVGVAVPDDGAWTRPMLDAAVVWGDAATIGAKLHAYGEAGASEVICSPFGGDDVRDVLRGLAKE